MLDRAERSLTPAEQRKHHAEADPHVRGRWLADVVLGAQDGLVNTLGIVLGVAAASADARVVFAAGMAAGIAESLSMAAVARGDLFRSERAREYRHVELTPEIERDEVRALYAKKGFEGELLERVVTTICANKDVWVALMMAEEHEQLLPVDRRSSLRAAGIIGGGGARWVDCSGRALRSARIARRRHLCARSGWRAPWQATSSGLSSHRHDDCTAGNP